jgi:hypothetical protein
MLNPLPGVDELACVVAAFFLAAAALRFWFFLADFVFGFASEDSRKINTLNYQYKRKGSVNWFSLHLPAMLHW